MSVSATTAGSGDFLLVSDSAAFGKKLKELQSAREEAEAAFKALRIGRDAAKAFEDAEKMKREYEARIEAANDEAAAIVAEAKAEAKTLKADSAAKLKKATDEATAIIDDARKVADALKAEAEEAKAAMKGALAETKAAKKAHDEAAAGMGEAEKIHRSAAQEQQAMRERYEALIAKIQAVLQEG